VIELSIFTRTRRPPSHSPQQRYEQSFEGGGRPGAFGILRIAEETAEWPPRHILEWGVRGGQLNSAEVVRLAGALIRGAKSHEADFLYALVISEWAGSERLVDALMTLSLKAGVRPSAAAVEEGLKELHRRHPGAPALAPESLSEIAARLRVPVGAGLFEDVAGPGAHADQGPQSGSRIDQEA
jgi:hypothetical protein